MATEDINFDLGDLGFDISDVLDASFDQSITDFANESVETDNVNDKSSKAELLDYINKQQNKNTARKTNNEAKKFIDWLQQPPRNEFRPIESLPAEILDSHIGQYLLTLKRKDGKDYQPDSLTSIHRAINRYLQSVGFTGNLVKDTVFQVSKKVLESKRKELKKSGLGNHDLKADPLTPEEEEILWEKGELGNGNPEALQRTVWFLTTKLMGKQLPIFDA